MLLFNELTEESKILKMTLPHLVPVTKNPDDETFEQIADRQNKFLILSDSIKNKLASLEASQRIYQISQYFSLRLLQVAEISRAIRSYYFGELKLEDMPFVLAKEIPIDLSKAQEISKMVIEKIINDKSIEEKYQAQIEKLTLLVAMEKYPEIGEQPITAARIKLKGFPDPVRPSVKNWLADYTFTIGQDKHDTMKRGNYLFQSVNAKVLSAADRQKLGYILKAYDENSEISVNKGAKRIVFPAVQVVTTPKTQPAVSTPKPQPIPSDHHGISNEKYPLLETKSQPFRSSEIHNLSEKPEAAKPSNLNYQAAANINKNSVSSQKTEPENNIHFSSPQRMQSEKVFPAAPTPAPSRPMPKPMGTKPSPFIIRPVSREEATAQQENQRQLPKNVVNLKEDK